MLLLEIMLVLEEVQIPVWLLRYHTSHDVVSLCHRLFPAYMNGCRSIVGAFYVDRKANRVAALKSLSSAMHRSAQLGTAVLQDVVGNQDVAECIAQDGIMALAYKSKEKNLGVAAGVVQMKALIDDPVKLMQHQHATPSFAWIRNLLLFAVCRYIFKGYVPVFPRD